MPKEEMIKTVIPCLRFELPLFFDLLSSTVVKATPKTMMAIAGSPRTYCQVCVHSCKAIAPNKVVKTSCSPVLTGIAVDTPKRSNDLFWRICPTLQLKPLKTEPHNNAEVISGRR